MSRNSYRWDTSAFWPQFLTTRKISNPITFWSSEIILIPTNSSTALAATKKANDQWWTLHTGISSSLLSNSRTSTDLQGLEATSTVALWSMRWNDSMSQMFAEIYWECSECLSVAFAQIYSRWSRAEHITRLGIDWILLCKTSKPCWSWKLSASCDMLSSLHHKLIRVAVTTKRLVPLMEWSYWLPRSLCAM